MGGGGYSQKMQTKTEKKIRTLLSVHIIDQFCIILSNYLSLVTACVYVCVFICTYFRMSVSLSIFPSGCLLVCSSICVPVSLSVCLSVHLSVYLFVYLSNSLVVLLTYEVYVCQRLCKDKPVTWVFRLVLVQVYGVNTECRRQRVMELLNMCLVLFYFRINDPNRRLLSDICCVSVFCLPSYVQWNCLTCAWSGFTSE